MTYRVVLKPRATKDPKQLPPSEQARVVKKVEALRDDLAGDVKKLKNFVPQYRLRIRNYRVVFAVADDRVDVYRVQHRKDVYRRKDGKMTLLQPEFLVKDGKKQFVVLTYEECETLQEALADAQDLLDLREAVEAEGD